MINCYENDRYKSVSDLLNSSFQEYIINQKYHNLEKNFNNSKYEIITEENSQEVVLGTQVSSSILSDHLSNRETFRSTCLESYFSLYPDMFISSNLLDNYLEVPPYIDSIFQNEGVNINQTSYEHFTNNDPDNELSYDHFSKPYDILFFYYHVFSFNSSSLKEEINNKKSEVIYDDNLSIENVETFHPLVMVMSGSQILNPSSQYIFEDEKSHFSVNDPINSHFHYDDFNIQNTIPIYDSYDDQTAIPNHDPEFFLISKRRC